MSNDIVIDKESNRILRKQYDEATKEVLRTMRPFDGIALPSKALLHIVQCESLIDPLRLSLEITKHIFLDNLQNPAMSFAFICETNRDKNDVVTLSESIGISDQIHAVTIGNTKKKINLSKYSMVILVDHDYDCNDETSIGKLKQIRVDGPIVITYRFRNKFSESYRLSLLKETSKDDIVFYCDRLDLPDLITSSKTEFYSNITALTMDVVDCMDEYDDPDDDNVAMFMRSISGLLNEIPFQYLKGIVLCETEENANFMVDAFEAYRQSDIYHPRLLECTSYSKENFNRFSDLNNRFASSFFLKDDTASATESDSTKSDLTQSDLTQSGMLFITIEDLIDLMRSPIQLRYVNFIFTLNTEGLSDDLKYIVSQVLSANRDTESKTFVYFDVYRKLLGRQLSNIYETFYHQNRVAEENEIRNAIDSGKKSEVTGLKKLHKLNSFTDLNILISNNQIMTEISLTDKKREKLESIYSIRRADQDYINRHSIAYVNMISRAKQSKNPMSTTGMHVTESPYLYLPSPKTGKIKGFIQNKPYLQVVTERTDELKIEVDQIVNAKSDRVRLKNYTGPVWLGRDNGKEREGSLIAFADESNGTVEFAQILGTHRFTRTYKRDGWTEKENRDKNILFLSPVFERQKLSEFNRRIRRPAYQRFCMMEKVYLN
jgi:hypothetical protein